MYMYVHVNHFCRYPLFPKVAGGGINEMSDIKKKLVIVLVSEDKQQQTTFNRCVRAAAVRPQCLQVVTLIQKSCLPYMYVYMYMYM